MEFLGKFPVRGGRVTAGLVPRQDVIGYDSLALLHTVVIGHSSYLDDTWIVWSKHSLERPDMTWGEFHLVSATFNLPAKLMGTSNVRARLISMINDSVANAFLLGLGELRLDRVGRLKEMLSIIVMFPVPHFNNEVPVEHSSKQGHNSLLLPS